VQQNIKDIAMETVVITGANRGIGLELARHFLAAGKRVIAGCRNPATAVELTMLTKSAELDVFALDVADDNSVAEFCSHIGTDVVDVLINNAGVMGGDKQGINYMDYAAWLHTFNVNTLGPFRLATALLANLKRATRPRIITLSSQMGAFGLPMGTGSYAYRSSKSAVSKVMQVLALELKGDGIIVCPVHPGWVRTDMGGAHAEIPAPESAAGLARLIEKLTLAESGRFWTWEGKEHPW
jgi:NAD(P)-dependent dehydrogenase (short-subunit alcohol dehydrogenase family)